MHFIVVSNDLPGKVFRDIEAFRKFICRADTMPDRRQIFLLWDKLIDGPFIGPALMLRTNVERRVKVIKGSRSTMSYFMCSVYPQFRAAHMPVDGDVAIIACQAGDRPILRQVGEVQVDMFFLDYR